MSTIERQVMASVAVIYAARKLTSRTALKCYVFVLSVTGITFFVSLPHVAQNFQIVSHGGVGSVAAFLVSAVLGTTLVVQLALLLGVGALASLVLDLVRPATSRPVAA